LNLAISDWQGRKVWLVGASSGIGAALAESLMQKGAIVAVSARRQEVLNSLISGRPGKHLAIAVDVGEVDKITRAHQTIIEHWGHIDLVIWLAGTYKAMRADALDLEVIKQTIDANLTSVYSGLSVYLPAMLKSKAGGIALVSSVAGYRGLPKAIVYGPTKAALINLAEVLYNDLKPSGISVYLINPGFVKTPLTDQNEFKMPALISSTDAAEQILKGFAKGQFEIHFPKRFTRLLKTLRLLPYRLYFALIKNVA
jgi:short-subunit dehydrogenase